MSASLLGMAAAGFLAVLLPPDFIVSPPCANAKIEMARVKLKTVNNRFIMVFPPGNAELTFVHRLWVTEALKYAPFVGNGISESGEAFLARSGKSARVG